MWVVIPICYVIVAWFSANIGVLGTPYLPPQPVAIHNSSTYMVSRSPDLWRINGELGCRGATPPNLVAEESCFRPNQFVVIIT